MDNTIDARGLSCPQPVIMTLNEIKRVKQGEIAIMVDTETAKENISRASAAQGWTVADTQSVGEDFKIIIRREA
jgi:tRNA 2-thiouridine synthesizing protein A